MTWRHRRHGVIDCTVRVCRLGFAVLAAVAVGACSARPTSQPSTALAPTAAGAGSAIHDITSTTREPAQLGGGGGHDMSPVDVADAPAAAASARGMEPLEPTVVDGAKEFHIRASVVRWNILPNVQVGAYAYNEQVPGPEIRVTEGDAVRMVVKNDLPRPTTIHWHGLQIPNDQDGAGSMTQRPIEPGENFAYTFTVPATPGTYFYHSHVEADRQQTLGLYGPFIIDARAPATTYDQEHTIMLGEWMVKDGATYPPMDMDGMMPNYFTINGKSWPATERYEAKVGDRILLRLIGSGQFIHPMHVHGQPFEIVATDGNPVPAGARLLKDTVLVGPGERYDVAFTARAPGMWMIHCHINHHLTNDGQEEDGAGGLTTVLDVAP